jgi:hypothetical protein
MCRHPTTSHRSTVLARLVCCNCTVISPSPHFLFANIHGHHFGRSYCRKKRVQWKHRARWFLFVSSFSHLVGVIFTYLISQFASILPLLCLNGNSKAVSHLECMRSPVTSLRDSMVMTLYDAGKDLVSKTGFPCCFIILFLFTISTHVN